MYCNLCLDDAYTDINIIIIKDTSKNDDLKILY